MAIRIQTRRGNGQYRQATLGHIGPGNDVCGKCGQCHPYKRGVESPPTKCACCGEYLNAANVAESLHGALQWLADAVGARDQAEALENARRVLKQTM